MDGLEVTPWVGGLLIAAGLWVSYTDLRWRRIQNLVTFPMILGGIALNAVPKSAGGWALGFGDWRSALVGFAVGFAILLPPFALNLVKAGDVKYLAGVGALGGPWVAAFTFLYGSLVHGVVCLVVLRRRGEVKAAFENIGYYFKNSLLARHAVDFTARSQGQVPYALGLSLGCLLALLCKWTTGTVFPLWA